MKRAASKRTADWGSSLVAGMTDEQRARLVNPLRLQVVEIVPVASLAVPSISLVKKPARSKQPNKTETRWMQIQQMRVAAGTVKSVSFEAITFVIDDAHGRKMRFTPDILVIPVKGPPELHECKGAFVFDGARERFALARLQFPFFVWVWAQWVKGQWIVETYPVERT